MVRSRERPFRAGLPQGSVLAPTLFTLWSADLIQELRRVPRTSVFVYADDTATLSAGSSVELARGKSPAGGRHRGPVGPPVEDEDRGAEDSGASSLPVESGREGVRHQGGRHGG